MNKKIPISKTVKRKRTAAAQRAFRYVGSSKAAKTASGSALFQGNCVKVPNRNHIFEIESKAKAVAGLVLHGNGTSKKAKTKAGSALTNRKSRPRVEI